MNYLERFQQIAQVAEAIPEEYAEGTKNRSNYVHHVLDGLALDEPCCGDRDRAEKPLGGFALLDLDLTDECNLSCEFCYTKGGHGKGNDITRTKRFLDWFVEQAPAGKAIKVNLFGGEPMLEWETVLLIDDWLKATGRKYGLQVVTNMTLLDDEKLAQAIKRRIGISPSIDGCPEAEDYHRRFKPGTVGSSELVYANAKRLLKVRPGVRARMTISPETCCMLFRSHVFLCKEVGFRTVNGILAGGAEWSDRQIAILKGQFRKLTNWWINEVNQGRYYDFYYLRNMFTGMFGQRKDSLCASGTSRIAVDTNGNFWPCHRFCNRQSHEAWKLGTIDEGVTNQALRKMIGACRVSKLFECNCVAWPSCHAHCMHELMQAKRSEIQDGRLVFAPTDITCKMWPFYWREARRALEKVKDAPIFRKRWGEAMDKAKTTTAAPAKVAAPSMQEAPRKGEDEPIHVSHIGEVGMELPLPPKVKDAPDDFIVSLVISARDEGDELVKTVESARVATTGRLEIVLVDDGSRQDTTKALQNQWPDVTVVRVGKPVGAGRGRNIGVAASTGRVVVLCDGHMRYPKGIFQELGKVAIERQCFVCPGVGSMHGGAQGYGTRLTWHRDIKIGNDYERAKEPGLRRVTGLLGACYFMPREIFEKLGGWTAQLGIWGYEEPVIGAWAYLHEVPILTDSKWLVKHLYRSERNKGNLPVPWGGPPVEDLAINIYAGHARLFSKHTNHNVWFKAELYKRYAKSPRMVDAVRGTNMMGSDIWQKE